IQGASYRIVDITPVLAGASPRSARRSPSSPAGRPTWATSSSPDPEGGTDHEPRTVSHDRSAATPEPPPRTGAPPEGPRSPRQPFITKRRKDENTKGRTAPGGLGRPGPPSFSCFRPFVFS